MTVKSLTPNVKLVLDAVSNYADGLLTSTECMNKVVHSICEWREEDWNNFAALIQEHLGD